MDPALRELLRTGAGPDDEIEAVVRLRHPDARVPGLRLVARFGTVATCRLRGSAVPVVHADPDVVSLKASRAVVPHAGPRAPEPVVLPTSGGAFRTGPATERGGAGVVVGVVDWRLDVAHPDFLDDDGGTRVLALWDQRGPAGERSPSPYGYGVVHDRAAIDDALASGRPYETLDFHPGDGERAAGSHGTHVTGIAAGNGRGGGPVGTAPLADVVFVHLSDRASGAARGLGSSVRVLEAVDFVRRAAAGRPWVVNLSLGQTGGPHDGTSLVERAFDELLSGGSGCLVVQSAGNYAAAGLHSAGSVPPAGSRTLAFRTRAGDRTPNEVEVWYPGDRELVVELLAPGARSGTRLRLGADDVVLAEGAAVGWAYHRAFDPNNGCHHVDVFLAADAPAGVWCLRLTNPGAAGAVRYDAWIERDDSCGACQARFEPGDRTVAGTVGTIATSHRPLVVGAYDADDPENPVARFSSRGPTRDGRHKPDLVAPGVRILSARSAPQGAVTSPGEYVEKSGTSMAAPQVTGAVALCLEVLGPRAAPDRVRALVLATVRPVPPALRDVLGRGYLDLDALVASLDALPPSARPGTARPTALRGVGDEPTTKEQTMTHDDHLGVAIAPDRVYRELLYRPHGAAALALRRRYEVVAEPLTVPLTTPGAGDVVVTVTLGRPGIGLAARLAGAPRWRLGPGGDEPAASPGWYADAEPMPSGAGPGLLRVLDPRGTVPPGVLVLRPRAATPAPDAAAEYAAGAVVAEDDGPPAGSPGTWQGDGTPEQLDFRARVLAAHVRRSGRNGTRPAQPDLPKDRLRTVRDTDVEARRDTADAVERMLDAATADLAAAKAAGDEDAARTVRLTVGSGYRAASHQHRLWLRYFSAKDGYYNRTAARRETLPGGPHGDAAVEYMLDPDGFALGGRIAAPGYSNHQNGIAVDLVQVRTPGHEVVNKSYAAYRATWRATWFHHWLVANAERFGFRPLKSEEWHWEYRPAGSGPAGAGGVGAAPATSTTGSLGTAAGTAGGLATGSRPPSGTLSPVEEHLGGRLWTFECPDPRLPVAAFCPPAALGRDRVEVLVYAHGLLGGCRRPATVPAGIVTDAPFRLGNVVAASGRPVVLVVPLLDWHSPGGSAIFGPGHGHWHPLGDPSTLAALVDAALASTGVATRAGSATARTPRATRLVVAGHSRAYDVLEPLVRHRADAAFRRPPLSALTDVVCLDSTYTGDVDAWTRWVADDPGLTVHVFYRPDSPTAVVGDALARRRAPRLVVSQAEETHCALPARRLAEVLAGLPPAD